MTDAANSAYSRRCVIGLLLAALPLLPACAHTQGVPAVDVLMIGSDRFLVEGYPARAATLARRLKAAGAGPQTRIRITIEHHTSPADIQYIVGRLTRAGFRRVFCTRPRAASASPSQ